MSLIISFDAENALDKTTSINSDLKNINKTKIYIQNIGKININRRNAPQDSGGSLLQIG